MVQPTVRGREAIPPRLVDGAATIVQGEALDVLRTLPDGCAGLVYVDPPFNTGGPRTGLRTTTTADATATRLGFAGRRYRVERQTGPDTTTASTITSGGCARGSMETRRILAPHGSLYFHIDPRESHYCKVLLDEIFGRECFLNEVVWAYDYGARTKRRWPAKHDVILVYVQAIRADITSTRPRSRASPTWRRDCRRPSARRAASCRPTSGGTPSCRRRRASAPATRRRNRSASCAGSWPRHRVRAISSSTGARAAGPPGAAAAELGRRFLLVDDQAAAIEVMRTRLAGVPGLAGDHALMRWRSSSPLAMITRWISLVPSPMISSGASR